MTQTRDDVEAKSRLAASLARKLAQTPDGRAAMADYRQAEQTTIDRSAKLKAERIARKVASI